jgi:hypothetical protein
MHSLSITRKTERHSVWRHHTGDLSEVNKLLKYTHKINVASVDDQ